MINDTEGKNRKINKETNLNTMCGTLQYCRNNNLLDKSKIIVELENYFSQEKFKQELMLKLIKRDIYMKNKIDKEKEEARIALHDFIRATKNKKYIYSSINKKKSNLKFNVLKKLKENYFSKIINDKEGIKENEPLLKNKEYTNVNHLKQITNKLNCIIS